ncbi:MAG: hypothetical protein AVDCRST_MAG93-4009 [uncultured Chloroflexia bacterium]|uniref:Uncharacterized protein n=1 Tax=uncultured Chloroflexia bacterium TaxID=1672391 RepID=A0A6J4K0I6_9CHLR|nr:MAG: hypothetical protein AVDCRST_MAG93-4009 [uncultured Chloroflexia bacterium]
MGGTGSGRWTYHDKKLTVEECWAINVSDVARVVDASKPGLTSASLRPIKPATGRKMPLVRCAIEVGDDGTQLLRLSYEISVKGSFEHAVEQVLRLQTTRPNFGGVRWWFSCPRTVDGEECGRRVGKLYLPPGGRYFACRLCLGLSYESCQKSHHRDGLLALMAGETSGEAFEAVKRAFTHPSKEARRQKEGPSPNLLDAFDEMFGRAKGR